MKVSNRLDRSVSTTCCLQSNAWHRRTVRTATPTISGQAAGIGQDGVVHKAGRSLGTIATPRAHSRQAAALARRATAATVVVPAVGTTATKQTCCFPTNAARPTRKPIRVHARRLRLLYLSRPRCPKSGGPQQLQQKQQ